MNCIKVKRNNLLNNIYSSISPDFRFKETPYVNFFTDPELSSSLYCEKLKKLSCVCNVEQCIKCTHHCRKNKKIFIRTGLCLPAADVQALQCYICGSHIDVTCAGRFEQGGYKGEQTTIDPTTFLPCQICTKNEYTHNGNTRTYDGTLLTLIDNTQVAMLHITSCSSTQT